MDVWIFSELEPVVTKQRQEQERADDHAEEDLVRIGQSELAMVTTPHAERPKSQLRQ